MTQSSEGRGGEGERACCCWLLPWVYACRRIDMGLGLGGWGWGGVVGAGFVRFVWVGAGGQGAEGGGGKGGGGCDRREGNRGESHEVDH